MKLPASSCLAVLAWLVAPGLVRTAEPPPPPDAKAVLPDLARLNAMTARFAPVPLKADLSGLPESERLALARLVDAARVMDALFLRQVSAGNESLLVSLAQDSSPLGRARLHYFLINKGPWSRLDDNTPFVPGVGEKPKSANFYPSGASKEEVETWIKGLPETERPRAEGFFTTIRRAADGSFTPLPYSLEYQGELARAADLLRQAAARTSEATLRAFLTRRAEAFLTNDYYASDVAWMELDSAIEPTIGPYEVYEDGWFSAKASFEAFIALRDEAFTAKLSRLSGELQWLEDNLPIDPKYRNPKLGALAPIRVVNVVFTAGEANSGVQTAAFNLPNDERVVKEKGSKRVMLRNIQEAKFQKALLPIAAMALSREDQKQVSFDAFFTHILMHELMHGLGPHNIVVDGKPGTVRQQLREDYSTIEEAKADIAGLWALQRLVDKGVLDRSLEKTMYVTFLASTFRSLRFGLGEAHARGIALQLGSLMEAGAFTVRADGTFAVNPERVKPAVEALTNTLLTLEAQGDREKAKDLLARLAVVRPPVKRLLDRLASVPVDIEPLFVTADALTEPETQRTQRTQRGAKRRRGTVGE